MVLPASAQVAASQAPTAARRAAALRVAPPSISPLALPLFASAHLVNARVSDKIAANRADASLACELNAGKIAAASAASHAFQEENAALRMLAAAQFRLDQSQI